MQVAGVAYEERVYGCSEAVENVERVSQVVEVVA